MGSESKFGKGMSETRLSLVCRSGMKFRFKARPNVSAARDRSSTSLNDSRKDTEDHLRQPVSDSGSNPYRMSFRESVEFSLEFRASRVLVFVS